MSSSQNRGRRRPYGRYSFCCDMTNRLRNDTLCLLNDAKRVAKVRLERLATQHQYDTACNHLTRLLNSLVFRKIRAPDTPQLTDFKILETKHFLRYFWTLLNTALTKEAKKAVFISYKGLGVTDYVSQLKDMICFIQNNSLQFFRDQECVTIFNKLAKQLETSLVPELAKADAVLSSANSVDYSLTAVNFLKQIGDLYVNSPKWVDYHSICHHFLADGSLPADDTSCDSVPILALAALLDDTIFGHEPIFDLNPAVESRARDFLSLADEMRLMAVAPILDSCKDSFEADPHLIDTSLIDLSYFRISQLQDKALKNVQDKPKVPGVTRGRGRPRKRQYEFNSDHQHVTVEATDVPCCNQRLQLIDHCYHILIYD